MAPPAYSKGVIALVMLAFGFGLTAIITRYMSEYLTVFQQLTVALGSAFLFSMVIFPRSITLHRLRKISRRDWGILLFRVCIGYLLATSLYRASITLTKISNVTFIQSIPFAAIYGWVLFKEKFTIKKFLLLMIALGGVVLISIQDYSSLLSFGKGEIFSFISSALFALSFVSRKWQTDFLNDKEVAQILLFLGTIALVIITVIRGELLPPVDWQWLLIVSVVLTGFFNAINIYLINYGFRHVKAVLASNILTLESVFALILAFIFYRELPTLKEFLGGVLIIGSVVQMNRLEE